ncbi:MAG: dephospho-CoA kinase [Treponema sp.]|nr:dephospho-CoA kinase [Treponema sp.]
MIIGLTGTYCSGKNYTASLLESRGLPVLDVDKLGYKALELEKEAINARFGNDLKKLDKTWQQQNPINRRLLGQVVFGNPEKLAALESIVHPAANRLTDEWVAAQSGHCVINAALLHKSSVFERLDLIILVYAPFLTRFFRAKRRDKLPFKEIKRRFASQKDFYTHYLSKKAEIYRIGNHGLRTNRSIESQIDKLLIERIK